MTRQDLVRRAVVLAVAAAIACDGGSGGAGDGGADTDTETDTCAPVAWGEPTDFAEGMPVGNWVHHGYIDGDGDGVVEDVEVEFSLEDIHCAGYESIVLMVGDTT